MSHQQLVPHLAIPLQIESLNDFPAFPDAEKAHESVSPEQMLGRLACFFQRYLHCTPEQRTVLSLWALHTHCFSAARVTPYLNISSREKQSGKSLCLQLLSLVCADAWYATGISASALHRKIGNVRPTVLLDECQTIFGASDRKVRGLLVSGCQRGGMYEFAQRSSSPPSVVGVFCPKAFAGMAILPPAIDDRSIPIVLEAAKPHAGIARFFIEQAAQEAAPLVAWIKQWTADKFADIANAAPYSRELMPSQLNARQQDCVEPLLHLADLIGGKVPQHTRAALIKLFQHDSNQSHFLHLLFDIRLAFLVIKDTKISTSNLLLFLNGIRDRPWSTWHHGGPMTPIDLARILRPFGISPTTIRSKPNLIYKGYHAGDFKSLWQCHLDETNAEVGQ